MGGNVVLLTLRWPSRPSMPRVMLSLVSRNNRCNRTLRADFDGSSTCGNLFEGLGLDKRAGSVPYAILASTWVTASQKNQHFIVTVGNFPV
jgi:hypothetical protein